ncbi:MAG: hypothetical protein GC147_13440 [Porphyrobacter sp.]|nr:hypothetical protein [Porphyrobacter sp.]
MKAALPALALSLTLAACVPATREPASASLPPPAPVARHAPQAPPPATPAPLPAVPGDKWMDAPATPGDWRYQVGAGGPLAVFVGTGGKGEFVLTCDRPARSIELWRAGTSAGPRTMTIRTETATRSLTAVQAEDTNPYLAASLPAADPLLDAMALSKGRFAVEVEGQSPLYLPSWAEVTRVIEDCR